MGRKGSQSRLAGIFYLSFLCFWPELCFRHMFLARNVSQWTQTPQVQEGLTKVIKFYRTCESKEILGSLRGNHRGGQRSVHFKDWEGNGFRTLPRTTLQIDDIGGLSAFPHPLTLFLSGGAAKLHCHSDAEVRDKKFNQCARKKNKQRDPLTPSSILGSQ